MRCGTHANGTNNIASDGSDCCVDPALDHARLFAGAQQSPGFKLAASAIVAAVQPQVPQVVEDGRRKALQCKLLAIEPFHNKPHARWQRVKRLRFENHFGQRFRENLGTGCCEIDGSHAIEQACSRTADCRLVLVGPRSHRHNPSEVLQHVLASASQLLAQSLPRDARVLHPFTRMVAKVRNQERQILARAENSNELVEDGGLQRSTRLSIEHHEVHIVLAPTFKE